jgi:hypothetical protein
MIESLWGLFLYSIVTGMGFEVSHSITDLNRSYFSQKACISAAKALNKKSVRDKQVGLDSGVNIRYVCILTPKKNPSI